MSGAKWHSLRVPLGTLRARPAYSGHANAPRRASRRRPAAGARHRACRRQAVRSGRSAASATRSAASRSSSRGVVKALCELLLRRARHRPKSARRGLGMPYLMLIFRQRLRHRRRATPESRPLPGAAASTWAGSETTTGTGIPANAAARTPVRAGRRLAAAARERVDARAAQALVDRRRPSGTRCECHLAALAGSRGVSTTVEPCGAPTSSRSRSPLRPRCSAFRRGRGRSRVGSRAGVLAGIAVRARSAHYIVVWAVAPLLFWATYPDPSASIAAVALAGVRDLSGC